MGESIALFVEPRKVLSQTACVYGLSVDTLRGRTKARLASEARAVACFVAYRTGSVTYDALAEELGRSRQGVWKMVEGVAEKLRAGNRRVTRAVSAVTG